VYLKSSSLISLLTLSKALRLKAHAMHLTQPLILISRPAEGRRLSWPNSASYPQ